MDKNWDRVMSVFCELGGYCSWYSRSGGHSHVEYADEGQSWKESKLTLRSEIQSTRAIVYTLEPARLHAIHAPLAQDKVVPTHVDRTIVIAKCNSATSSEKEDTDKKEK